MTDGKHPSGAPWRNFYGRFKGKGLRKSQEAYLDEDLAKLSPGPVDWDANPERTPLDLQALFGGRDVWLEVGFGGGEHMVHQAALHPEVGIIGCEPYINGVAMLLGKIRKAGARNIAVYPGDVRNMFDVLPEGSISRAFLLYPDPWPKTRHHKRRFVSPTTLDQLARVIRPGGVFNFATDIEDYADWTLAHILRQPSFIFAPQAPGSWHTPYPGWQPTRYERKARREGRMLSFYFSFPRQAV